MTKFGVLMCRQEDPPWTGSRITSRAAPMSNRGLARDGEGLLPHPEGDPRGETSTLKTGSTTLTSTARAIAVRGKGSAGRGARLASEILSSDMVEDKNPWVDFQRGVIYFLRNTPLIS